MKEQLTCTCGCQIRDYIRHAFTCPYFKAGKAARMAQAARIGEAEQPSSKPSVHTELVATSCGLFANAQNMSFWPAPATVRKWAELMQAAADEIESLRAPEPKAPCLDCHLYCHCHEPVESGDSDLVCGSCGQPFHEAKIVVVTEPPVASLDDRMLRLPVGRWSIDVCFPRGEPAGVLSFIAKRLDSMEECECFSMAAAVQWLEGRLSPTKPAAPDDPAWYEKLEFAPPADPAPDETSARECGACDTGLPCSNQYGVCSRHGGRPRSIEQPNRRR